MSSSLLTTKSYTTDTHYTCGTAVAIGESYLFDIETNFDGNVSRGLFYREGDSFSLLARPRCASSALLIAEKHMSGEDYTVIAQALMSFDTLRDVRAPVGFFKRRHLEAVIKRYERDNEISIAAELVRASNQVGTLFSLVTS